MKKINKIIFSILALTFLFTSCMDRQGDVEALLDPSTHPTLIVTPLDPSINNSTINEGDGVVIPFEIKLSAPLEYAVNVGAQIVGGTADDSSYTITETVVPAYTTDAECTVTINRGCDLSDKELVLKIGAFTLDNMYLVNQEDSGYELSLNIEDDNMCCWTLVMYDSYGDGWNGASIEIDAEGDVNTYNMTNDSDNDGATANVNALVPNDKDLTISFNQGAWDGEITFEIFDAAGNLVLVVDTAPPPVGVLYTGHNDCP